MQDGKYQPPLSRSLERDSVKVKAKDQTLDFLTDVLIVTVVNSANT